MQDLENRTFDELQIGDTATLTRVLTEKDIQLFAIISGDINPAHLDKQFAEKDFFHQIVGHGMWSASLFSTLLGTQLPGPGTIYLNQSLKFRRPVKIGDVLTMSVKVKEKNAEKKHVLLDCLGQNQKGETVLEGVAEVLAPTEKMHCPRAVLPQVDLHYENNAFANLIAAAQKLTPLRTAVVHPVKPETLLGTVLAAEKKLIVPVLIGPKNKILQAAKVANLDLSPYEIVDTEHSHAAATMAVELAFKKEISMLMKGSLHTDEFLHAVLDSEYHLRTDRRLSHVFVLEVPSYPRPLLLTDAAINIQPDLTIKRDIVQNAIELALALNIPQPKVAILSAVETVNPKLQSTLDAAALCKMAERGQIQGGILDGPLAFDNAISEQAAAIKDIVSPVAGKADILLVPDVEAGNMLAKQLEYLAHSRAAGLVMGARIPIVLNSRSDDAYERMVSCAFALLLADYRRKQQLQKVAVA